MTNPGNRFVSPAFSIFTLRSMRAMMISQCLSLISNLLSLVDLLDFVQQVLLHGFFARNTQNVVRNERTVDE